MEYALHLEKRAVKYILTLPLKHSTQIKEKIISLGNNPLLQDCYQLTGYAPYIRVDIGEYRIIYRINEELKHIYIVLVGRRNDGDVYKKFKKIIN